MKIMLVISYDGSKFHGFQRQNNVRSVQGYLEDILSQIYEERILIKGAGRTDAFVHATYQVVHFVTNKKIKNLKSRINSIVHDINVKKVKKVADTFHARHSVKSKTYLYKVDLSGKRDANYYAIYKGYLDIDKMQDASKLLIGKHDFRNFVGGNLKTTLTTITKIKIYKRNDIIYFKFEGYAFYRYMVRNLVGALMSVGKGKVSKQVISNMLDNPLDTKRLPTAKPNGLYLIKIKY